MKLRTCVLGVEPKGTVVLVLWHVSFLHYVWDWNLEPVSGMWQELGQE